jgi:hypothetical protein
MGGMKPYESLRKRYIEKLDAGAQAKRRYDEACDALQSEIDRLWMGLGCGHASQISTRYEVDAPGLRKGSVALSVHLPPAQGTPMEVAGSGRVATVKVAFTMPAKGEGASLVLEGLPYDLDSHDDKGAGITKAFSDAFATKIDRELAYHPPTSSS